MPDINKAIERIVATKQSSLGGIGGEIREKLAGLPGIGSWFGGKNFITQRTNIKNHIEELRSVNRELEKGFIGITSELNKYADTNEIPGPLIKSMNEYAGPIKYNTLHNLEKMKLNDDNGYGTNDLYKLLGLFKKSASIDFSGKDWSTGHIQEIIDKEKWGTQSITEVDLRNTKVDIEILKYLADNCPNLKTVDLRGCNNVLDKEVKDFLVTVETRKPQLSVILPSIKMIDLGI